MIKARRLAYAALSTPNLEEQASYYSDTLGLFVSYRDKSRVVLTTQHGLECIVLEAGSNSGLRGLSFEVSSQISLEEVKVDIERAGITAELREGRTPCLNKVVAFKDSKGTEIELFNKIEFAKTNNEERGVGILKLGHVAYFVPDIRIATEFYERHLGFRRSDWREGRSMFMRCNTDHHTVNFFQGEQKLGHLAFEVKDFSELVRASDTLVRRGYPLDWGPARHTIGHNCACYHSNADGVRIELYAEMDQMNDEELGYYEPRPWHEDRPQRPKDWNGISSPRNKWIPGVP